VNSVESVSLRRPEGPEGPEDWLVNSVQSFEDWLRAAGRPSYDPYDVWGTRYGLWARRLYYRKHPVGIPSVAPLLLMEILFPQVRSVLVRKDTFATSDAQLVLAYLNLFSVSKDPKHLEAARAIAKELLAASVPGFSGHCWGYPFDWQNASGLWKRNTPYITATPYAYEVFVLLAERGGDPSAREVAKSIARFVHDDLRDTPTSAEAAAGSYSPFVNDKVVNASAYRAMVLFDAVHRFGLESYRLKAQRNLNFILESQRADGSWLYAVDCPSQSFIDHFHTCFVLKNLHKLNRWIDSEAVRGAIQRGWDYYRRALFEADDTPKSFAILPRTGIVKLEMYNMAEAITLGVLLRNQIPEGFALAKKLAERLGSQYQLANGHFVTRIYRGGIRHTLPFMRWPQAQLFYALTSLLVALSPGGTSRE